MGQENYSGQGNLLGQELIARHSNSQGQEAKTVYTSLEALSYLMW